MSASTPRHHRSLLVPGSSQRRWFVVISLILLTLLLVSGVLFYVFAQRRLEDEYFKAHSQIRTVMDMLLPWMIGVYLAGLAAASWLTLLLSRRLAGPLVGIRRQLEAVRAGDLEARVTLRRGDEYRELAEDINRLLESQSARQRELVALSLRLQSALDRLGEGNEAGAAVALAELRASHRRLDEILGARS